jgi:hypothetical protein
MWWAGITADMRWPKILSKPRLRLGFTGCLDQELPSGLQVIGDAALAVDPLSGHGLRLAFESVRNAIEVPESYQEWISSAWQEHEAEERRVYSSAGISGPFWQRRREKLHASIR